MTEQNSPTREFSSQEGREDDPLEELARIVSSHGHSASRHPSQAAPDAAMHGRGNPHAAAVADAPRDMPESRYGEANGSGDISFDLEAELMRELEGPAAASHPAWEQRQHDEAGEDGSAERDLAEAANGAGADEDISLEDQLLAELGFSGFDSDAGTAGPDEESAEDVAASHAFDSEIEAFDSADSDAGEASEEPQGGEIDLEREFQETFEAELAVGRAATAMSDAADADDLEAAPAARQAVDHDHGTVRHDEAADTHDLSDFDASTGHQLEAEAEWETAEGAADDDFDFDSAFQAELTQIETDEPAPPPAAAIAEPDQYEQPAPEEDAGAAFDSERSLEDHFAAVFAEELALGTPRQIHDEPQANDVHGARQDMSVAYSGPPDTPADDPHDEVEETYEATDDEAYDQAGPDYGDHTSLDFAHDEELDMEPALARGPVSASRGFRLAGVALGLALIIGLGAVSYGFFKGDETPTEPVTVMASDEPVKVKPEDPGGAKVANQDKAAYERVSGKFDEETKQEKLVNGEEQPVNIAAVAPEGAEAAAAGKTEERLVPKTQDTAATGLPALQPRRVRTLTVRPDGTIVPPADEPAAGQKVGEVAFATPSGGSAADTEALKTIDGARSTGEIPVPLPSPAVSATDSAATPPAAVVATPAVPAVSAVPRPVRTDPVRTESAAVAPDTNAPIAIAPKEVAAATPEPAAQSAPEPASTGQAVARSEWSVQVTSQRSAEDAEASYRNLRNRFPDLIEGRQMAIQRTEIEGKGVFFRVRIQADSREDAIDFCDKLKAAGGSCFATR